MAFSIKVLGTDVSVNTKRGVIAYKAPPSFSQTSGSDGTLFNFIELQNMIDTATGSVSIVIRDAQNSLAYKKVFAGQLGKQDNSGGRLWNNYRFLSTPILKPSGEVGIQLEKMYGSSYPTEVTDEKDCAMHSLIFGIGSEDFSTGSIEIEFSGGIEVGTSADVHCYMNPENSGSVPIAQMSLPGGLSGSMKLKINFSVIEIV